MVMADFLLAGRTRIDCLRRLIILNASEPLLRIEGNYKVGLSLPNMLLRMILMGTDP